MPRRKILANFALYHQSRSAPVTPVGHARLEVSKTLLMFFIDEQSSLYRCVENSLDLRS